VNLLFKKREKIYGIKLPKIFRADFENFTFISSCLREKQAFIIELRTSNSEKESREKLLIRAIYIENTRAYKKNRPFFIVQEVSIDSVKIKRNNHEVRVQIEKLFEMTINNNSLHIKGIIKDENSRKIQYNFVAQNRNEPGAFLEQIKNLFENRPFPLSLYSNMGKYKGGGKITIHNNKRKEEKIRNVKKIEHKDSSLYLGEFHKSFLYKKYIWSSCGSAIDKKTKGKAYLEGMAFIFNIAPFIKKTYFSLYFEFDEEFKRVYGIENLHIKKPITMKKQQNKINENLLLWKWDVSKDNLILEGRFHFPVENKLPLNEIEGQIEFSSSSAALELIIRQKGERGVMRSPIRHYYSDSSVFMSFIDKKEKKK